MRLIFLFLDYMINICDNGTGLLVNVFESELEYLKVIKFNFFKNVKKIARTEGAY